MNHEEEDRVTKLEDRVSKLERIIRDLDGEPNKQLGEVEMLRRRIDRLERDK